MAIAIFLVLLSLPMAGHWGGFFDDSYINDTEKRLPHVLPDFSTIRSGPKAYIANLESYLNDHFGFRSTLVTLNSLIRLHLGSSSSDKVTIGKDNWLFFSDSNIIAQYRGIENFAPAELDAWLDAARERKRWFSAKGISYLLVFFPEKTSAYPEYLPTWVTKVGPTRLEQVKEKLKGSGLDYVDVTSAVLAEKKRYPVYYKTDSHWNFHGGFVGYTEMMKSVRELIPGIEPLRESDIEFGYKTGYGQDLARILNLTESLADPNADFFTLRKPSRVVARESLFPDQRLPMRITTSLGNGLRALILCDSYTDLVEPYLNETFSEILYVPHGDQTLDEELIGQFKPDIVIQAMVERILRYPMQGIIPAGSLCIIDWGPREVMPGEKFYPQANGDSAIWIKAKNVTEGTIIMWGNEPLQSSTDVKNGVVTAAVPGFMYGKPGDYSIYLTDVEKKLVSQRVRIKVKQRE